ncbi:MAG: AAA family ATPase [Anaerolineae bacterium]|nr:AAA family ATPase [Anaerolineae bacterium]
MENLNGPYTETYTGARATPELVGREVELAQIHDAICDSSYSHVIYITGEGGRGKTRLVRHVLKNPPPNISVRLAQDVVDLYHTRARTVEGLLERVQDVFPGDFPQYDQKRSELNQSLAEHGSILPAQYEELSEAFFADWEMLAKKQRIVVVLDTVEKLHRQEDLAAKSLGLTEERPAVLEWLFKQFLSRAQNFVLLLTGRPYLEDLKQGVNNALAAVGRNDVQFTSMVLPGFTEASALTYFDAIIRCSEQGDENDKQVAKLIRTLLPEEYQRIMFHCLREAEPPVVAPILLALSIDYLAVSGTLPFSSSIEEACALTTEEREAICQKLGNDLITVIWESYRPADKVIEALGWLRKGGTIELLAAVADVSETEVTAMLEKIEDLSFVKRRPADDRYFLHDEMYDLIQRNAQRTAVHRGAEVFHIIREHYKSQIELAREAIAELFKNEFELPEPAQAAAARARLEDALVEDLFYQLRGDAVEGFQTYFRYAEEAIATHDQSLDEQLRSELLSFLAERDPSGKAGEIDGLFRIDIIADAAIRWVKRLVEAEKNREALAIIQRIQEDLSISPGSSTELIRAELDTWEGLAHVYLGDYEKAQELLVCANGALLDLLQDPDLQLMRLCAILARNYNNLGYLRRVQGQFVAASEAYRQALPYWRYVKIEAEHANTLTNYAYALALTGSFDEARRNADDALNLRKKLGTRIPLVLAYNTKSGVEMLGAHYREAEPFAERALKLAHDIEFQRGEGLALLMLSDVHRFMAEDPDLDQQKKRDLLENALSEAQKALAIFDTVGELERKIEALYHCGVAERQRCLLSPEEKRGMCTITALDYLEQVRMLAQEIPLWFLYFDASLGKAWTYYYAKNHEQLVSLLTELEEQIHTYFSAYLITPGHKPDICENTLVRMFGQISRWYVLRGVVAMDRAELEKSGHYFALALEHDVLIAPDGQGISRALNTIHSRLRRLNNRELLTVYESAAKTASDYGWHKEQCRFWRELENTYGPYEVFRRLKS